jgi:hypothetical protein
VRSTETGSRGGLPVCEMRGGTDRKAMRPWPFRRILRAHRSLAGEGAGRSLYCFLVPSGRAAMGDLGALMAARPGPMSAPNGFSWPETGLMPVPQDPAGR